MKHRIADFRPDIETFMAALFGIMVFTVLGLPSPTLSGAMVGVAVLLAFGREARLAVPLRDAGMLISGVAMGSAVTPDMINTIHRYPLSLMMLLGLMFVGMWLSYAFFRVFGRWDRETAFFASVPGALSVVMATSAETKADGIKVAMAQCTRLFILFAVLPSLIALKGGIIVLQPKDILGPLPFVFVFASGLLLAVMFLKAGLAAPWLFGGMIASAVLHGSGLIKGDVHHGLVQLGFGLVGMMIGTRYAGITRDMFFRLLLISLGSVAIGLAVTLLGALLAERFLTGVSFGQAVVAFSPGALEGMIVLGAGLGLDPIFTGLHHLVRFFTIGLALPLLTPLVTRQSKNKDSS